jgi:hypothetical protein
VVGPVRVFIRGLHSSNAVASESCRTPPRPCTSRLSIPPGTGCPFADHGFFHCTDGVTPPGPGGCPSLLRIPIGSRACLFEALACMRPIAFPLGCPLLFTGWHCKLCRHTEGIVGFDGYPDQMPGIRSVRCSFSDDGLQPPCAICMSMVEPQHTWE